MSVNITPPPPNYSLIDTPDVEESTRKALLIINDWKKKSKIILSPNLSTISLNSSPLLISVLDSSTISLDLESTRIQHTKEKNATKNLLDDLNMEIDNSDAIGDVESTSKQVNNAKRKLITCQGCKRTFIKINLHKCKVKNK